MRDNNDSKTPQLASLVQAGDSQTCADKINDFIFMIRDVSNLYLVKTNDGDVLINTGFKDSTERNAQLLAPIRSGPLKAIFLTQAHVDHYGGVPALKEAETQVIAQSGFVATEDYFNDLKVYLGRRSHKLWSGTIKRGNAPVPYIIPDTPVDERYECVIGERSFELIASPGGESPDSAVVWLANDKVLFTGNLFGPVYMSMPNFNTLRGDKPRSVDKFLRSLKAVTALNAELLITGHGEPIAGKDRIRTDLEKLYDAVDFVRRATIDGMNAGKDLYTLMQDITLPAEVALGEFHGKTSWAVKSIWHEYSGWFMYDSTTSLYATPRSSVDRDLVELCGGVSPLVARARQKLAAGGALEAMHLLDIALGADPKNRDALTSKHETLTALLNASGSQNLSETMWLKSEISAVKSLLTAL